LVRFQTPRAKDHTLKMEAGGSSEMFLPMYQTTQSKILTIM